MGMQFEFAAVPFENDGRLRELWAEGPDPQPPKEGVIFLKTIGSEEIPVPLELNAKEIVGINLETKGIFLKLVNGHQRYLLLESRRDLLQQLRKCLSNTNIYRNFLEVFLENVEQALKKYKTKAALVVY